MKGLRSFRTPSAAKGSVFLASFHWPTERWQASITPGPLLTATASLLGSIETLLTLALNIQREGEGVPTENSLVAWRAR